MGDRTVFILGVFTGMVIASCINLLVILFKVIKTERKLEENNEPLNADYGIKDKDPNE